MDKKRLGPAPAGNAQARTAVPQVSESRDLDKVIVRLPDGMRDALKATASENNRSVNAEIVARLSASLASASAPERGEKDSPSTLGIPVSFRLHTPGETKEVARVALSLVPRPGEWVHLNLDHGGYIVREVSYVLSSRDGCPEAIVTVKE